MPQIHFIDGEKGGVGKSFFCRAFVYYLSIRDMDYYLVDSDRSNPDVYYRHPDISRTVFFSEIEKKSREADQIFELSLKRPVIVNLPSQIESSVAAWIERNGLLDELGHESNLQLYKWFVCTGAHDSITLFIESCEKFQGKIKHVLVKNLAFTDEDDWEVVFRNYPELQKLIDKYSILQVVLPRLGTYERNVIDQNLLTFKAAIAPEQSLLGGTDKQRVKNFLKALVQSLDCTEILTPESFDNHSVKETLAV